MHPPSSQQPLILRILNGEDSSATARTENSTGMAGDLFSGEDGMLSFVTVIVVLGFVILIGLVGNAGHATNQKLALQNKADAAAYSASLWQARGMNAITTTNHLMGEVTAMAVILESFGGPVLRLDDKVSPDDNKNLNDKIEDNKDETVPRSAPSTAYLQFDAQLIQFVADLLLDKSNEGKLRSGAAIYDAQLTLKYTMYLILTVKRVCAKVANVASKIPYFGWMIDAALAAVQIALSAVVVKIGQEWITLKAVEGAVGFVWNDSLREAMILGLLPSLSWYGDTVAGQMGGATSQRASVVNKAIEPTLQRLSTDNTTLAIYPNWLELRLPVVREEPPYAEKQDEETANKESLGPWGIPPRGWDGNRAHPDLKNVFRAVNEVKKVGDFINDKFRWIEGIEETFDLLGSAIPDWVKKTSSGLSDSIDIFKAFKIPPGPDADGYDSNPSRHKDAKKEHRIADFYWEVGRTSQWTRATYPYVDSFRAPIMGFLRETCRFSNAETYYANWTNRYTLVIANEIRAPEEDEQNQDKEKQNAIAELKQKIKELRSDFNKALNGDEQLFEKALEIGEDPFDTISDELREFVDGWRQKANGLGIVGQTLSRWIEEVMEHRQVVPEVAEGTMDESFDDLSTDDFQELEEVFARIEALHNLLQMLEDLIATFDLKPPHMYVMREMEPLDKGHEPWTSDNTAEGMFTLIAMAERPTEPAPFSPFIFRTQVTKPTRTFAQAMFYNANGRDVDQSGSNSSTQPNTGWDTLNWAPAVKAPEWGRSDPSGGGRSSNFAAVFRPFKGTHRTDGGTARPKQS